MTGVRAPECLLERHYGDKPASYANGARTLVNSGHLSKALRRQVRSGSNHYARRSQALTSGSVKSAFGDKGTQWDSSLTKADVQENEASGDRSPFPFRGNQDGSGTSHLSVCDVLDRWNKSTFFPATRRFA